MFKNIASQKVAVYAWDSANSVPKTGDAANITAYISKDGGSAVVSNDANPTELDATNFKGWYLFDLTQAETNCDLFGISPVSATADIVIEPQMIYTNPPNFTTLGIESDGDLTKCNLVATTTTNTDMLTSANILTTALTESYAAQGATMTLSQALYMLWSATKSMKDVDTTTPDSLKIDDTTVAMSFLTDSATSPTEVKRTA